MRIENKVRKPILHFCAVSLLFLIFLLILMKHGEANHGPASGGGAVSTIPAITLKKNKFSLSLGMTLTELESMSRSRLFDKGIEAGGFDASERTFLYTFSVGYGITDDFSLGLATGWFETINFRESELEDNEVEIFKANPDGLTDLWFTTKYRFFRGRQGHFAFLAGIKFPIGRDDIKNDEGESLEAVEQPGSGSYDASVGFAYSRWFTENWTMDTNIKYTFRTEGARDYKIGDRIDLNFANSYQVIPRKTYPNFAPIAEINVRHLFRDEQNGSDITHSGGTTVFISPGIRAAITSRFGVTSGVSFPIFQHLLGEQQETDLQISVGFNYNF